MNQGTASENADSTGLRQALRWARILEALDDAAVAELATLGEQRAFEAHQAVFREYESADSLFIVLAGTVVTLLRERGMQRELARHAEGDHFGRVALLDGRLSYVSAIGLVGGSVFVLSSMGCAALLAYSAPRASRALGTRTSALVPRPGPSADSVPRDASIQPAPDVARIRSISAAVAGVAHEINTPLGVIENAASFLSERLRDVTVASGGFGPEATELLAELSEAGQLIERNVALAAQLVRSFKNLSVGQLSEPREQADLLRLVNEVARVFRCKTLSALPPGPTWQGLQGSSGQHRLFLAPARVQIDVVCDLTEEQRTWTGYPRLFSRVILNLLANVERYAYPDFREGRVEIVLRERDLAGGRPGFEVIVRDFGAGIAPANLPRIFDPFFTTGRDRGGTGLGLAVAHNLTTQGLEGTIGAESEVDHGTTFEIRFPKVASERLEREAWSA
jgi:signal transduction histidine kinase